MKGTPILFTPENAQKVHEGTKTQTRRIIKSQPNENGAILWFREMVEYPGVWLYNGQTFKCPYGTVGDRLWVREAVAYREEGIVAYKAGGSCGAWMGDGAGGRLWIPHGWIQGFSKNDGKYFGLSKYGDKWRPSIHMPKWACRTWLELTEVKVERLQDCSSEDAIAEGAADWEGECELREKRLSAVQLQFAALWESIHDKGSWERNPWVWVLEYKKVMASAHARTGEEGR